MPERETLKRAERDKRKGGSPSSQAGEFVREEIEHVRQGKHGARSAKQAIAIGLSKARRAGVRLPPPKKGKVSERTRAQAKRDYASGRHSHKHSVSPRRSRAIRRALKREGKQGASHRALSRQARSSAQKRGSAGRHRAAMKAVRTKGRARLRLAAQKAARTRASRRK
jgi:hypothetical protein